MNNETDGKTEKAENFTHPLGVTLCKIIVYGDDMHTLTGQGIQIRGERRDKRFSFTGFHFGYSALVKNDTAGYLHRKVLHVEHAPCGFAANGKRFGENIIGRFTVLKA